MSRRIERKELDLSKLEPPESAASSLPVWTPVFGSSRVDFTFLSVLPNGRAVMKVLIAWQREKRGAYTVARGVRRFLLYVTQIGRPLGAEVLQSYRSSLDKARLSDSTRQGYYSHAKAFVSKLIDYDVISEQRLPAGFRNAHKRPKSTFTEQAKLTESLKTSTPVSGWLRSVVSLPGLDARGRETLAMSEGWMRSLRLYALERIERQRADWEIAAWIREHAKDRPFETRWRQQRSVVNAIGYLLEALGEPLPASTKWPLGVADYCKYRGWPVDRVKAATFPTVQALEPFYIVALTDDQLAPNVDSVLFYAFVGCISKRSTEEAVVSFGKFRGRPLVRTLPIENPTITSLLALERQIVGALNRGAFEANSVARDGGVPLFLHCSRFIDKQHAVRTVDPSMTAYMVRRFIKKCAETRPEVAPLIGNVTGENFRPTHLLIKRLRNASIFEVQDVAGHRSPQTTEKYLRRNEVEASSNVRFEQFQRYILGESRSSRVRRVGNGFHCHPENNQQVKCLRWDLCGAGEHGCSARRVVLESPVIVAEWIAWRDHIVRHREYLEVHRPARWSGVWAKRLLEYEVLLEKISERVKAQARTLTKTVHLLPLD